MSTHETKEHWEQHYGERERIWSGRVNVQFADVVGDLTPGRALDLGCGEGRRFGMARGTGLDRRRSRHLRYRVGSCQRSGGARDVADRIEFVQRDLSEGLPEGPFDLISSQFLHSKVPLDRETILAKRRGSSAARRAAGDRRPRRAAAVDVEAGSPRIPQRRRGSRRPESERRRIRAGPCRRRRAAGRRPGREQRPWMDNVIVLRRRPS